MYQIIAENPKGEHLNLTTDDRFEVLEVEGMTPPNAVIGSSVVSTMDGEIFNYARAGKRNILLTVAPRNPVEENRILLYQWFAPRQEIRIRYRNQARSVYTDGYVESFQGSLFENPQNFVISIICPEAFLRSEETVVQNGDYVESMFEFPFAIEKEGIEVSVYNRIQTIVVVNKSDYEIGMEIDFFSFGDVINPRIYRRDTLENMGFNIEMEESDRLQIRTQKGRKGVNLIRQGNSSNVINQMQTPITWMQLKPGENYFTYDADTGLEFLKIEFRFGYIYGGI